MSADRRLSPALEGLLESEAFVDILEAHPRGLVVQHLRTELDRVRRELGERADPEAPPGDVEDPKLYAAGVE